MQFRSSEISKAQKPEDFSQVGHPQFFGGKTNMRVFVVFGPFAAEMSMCLFTGCCPRSLWESVCNIFCTVFLEYKNSELETHFASRNLAMGLWAFGIKP